MTHNELLLCMGQIKCSSTALYSIHTQGCCSITWEELYEKICRPMFKNPYNIDPISVTHNSGKLTWTFFSKE